MGSDDKKCGNPGSEISAAGAATFRAAGGESFQLIPCLNDQPAYIDFLAHRVERWLDEVAAKPNPSADERANPLVPTMAACEI